MRVIDETTLRISFPSSPRQMYVFLLSIVVMMHTFHEGDERAEGKTNVCVLTVHQGGGQGSLLCRTVSHSSEHPSLPW